MIKLWVSDIDGTILNEENECSYNVRETIKKVLDRGVRIVLATGRMYAGAYPVACGFNLNTPIISYQGALIKHNEKILWERPINNSIARELINILRDKNIHTNLYNNDTLIVEDDNKKMMDDYCRGRFTTYKAVHSFDDIVLGSVSKLLAIIYDENKLVELQKEMAQKFEGKLAVVRSNKYYCEFTDIEATKGNALKFLADIWGFKKEEILASGDQDNDFDMLKNAGVKIAMANATEKLKSIADFVCPTVNESGIVQAIGKYILCE